MLVSGIIGIGNAGSQVASLALSEGMDAVVINSSENDLSTIPDTVIKFPLGDLKGAGKNREEAKRFLKDSIRKILEKSEFIDFMDNKDVIFVISSTGGGTGSGISPILTQILKKSFPDTYVILVGILPTLDEAYSTQINTLEYTQELYKKLDNPTYMFYDNDRMKDLPSHLMMEEINKAIVNDIKVLQGSYNFTTKYSSIDEKDMSMIISTSGRIVVASYTNIKEKDLDKMSIDEKLIQLLKTGAHAELQLDRVIKRSGVIANLNANMAQSFDDHLIELQKIIGAPVEEFSHLSINDEKVLPNNVFFVGAGLSPINDRIEKINERVAEIEAMQENDSTDEDVFSVDIEKANSKREYKKTQVDKTVDLTSIFNDFMNI